MNLKVKKIEVVFKVSDYDMFKYAHDFELQFHITDRLKYGHKYFMLPSGQILNKKNLFDEPLDYETVLKIMEIIEKICTDNKFALLNLKHEFEFIREIAQFKIYNIPEENIKIFKPIIKTEKEIEDDLSGLSDTRYASYLLNG